MGCALGKHKADCLCTECKRQARHKMGLTHGFLVDYVNHVYIKQVNTFEDKCSPKEQQQFRYINGIVAPRYAPPDVDLTRHCVDGRSPVCEEIFPGKPKKFIAIYVPVLEDECYNIAPPSAQAPSPAGKQAEPSDAARAACIA